MVLNRLITLVMLFCIAVPLWGQKNIIKTGATDLLTGHWNFSVERAINEKQSIQLRAGYWNPEKGLLIGEDLMTPEAYSLQDSKGGFSMSLEYRFYLSRKPAPRGFYIAPYLRSINQEALFEDQIDNRMFDVETTLNTFGAGAQIGYQILLADIVSLDFYFFGAGIDYHKLKLVYELQQPETGFDYNTVSDDVRDVFKDVNYLESKLTQEVTAKNLISKLPFLFPGFRLGASIGIAF